MKILLLNISLILSFIVGAQTYNLNYYFEQAKKNSPLINKINNDNKLIQLNLLNVKNILFKPFISIDANILLAPIISHDHDNQFQIISDGTSTNYTGYDLSYSDGGQYQAFVSIRQPLFIRGTYKAYSQKAKVANQLNKNNISLTQHELEHLVSHQYIICLKSKEQSEINKSLINELNNQLILMRKLVDNAIYKQSDLMLMQIETDNYRIKYQNYITKYRNNLSDLNLLCGINDTNLVEIKNVNFEISPDTVEDSQFIKKYVLDSIDIQSNLLLSDQKYKPQLNLFANAGLNAIYTPSFNRFGFAVGVNFSWNIFDGHQKNIQHNKSLIKMQTLEFDKQNFINQYYINRNKYLIQINSIDIQIKMVQNQLLEYEKLVNLNKLQFSQGQISIMDFKNLVRDVSAKKQEELLLKIQKQLLIDSYNYWNY